MTDLERDEAAGAKPLPQTDLERDEAAGAVPVGAIADTSGSSHPLLRAALQHVENFGRGSLQAAKDLGGNLLSADRAIGNAIVHPVDTFNAIRANPGANLREGMRGVNDNIPLANTIVQKLGGPAAESPEDAAAAIPGARAVGGVVGLPVSELVGGIAAKGIEKAAPVVASALRSVGAKAVDNQVSRAGELLEEKVSKRTRAGLQAGPVETAIAENPELRAAAGNDAKVAQVTAKLKQKAGGDLDRIYSSTTPEIDPDAPIAKLDARIAELRATKLPSSIKTAEALDKLRDDLETSIGQGHTSPQTLRAIQTDYQKSGYGKALPGDDAASAKIAAYQEASKAVGDAVLEHVTGMDYKAAKAAAASDPQGIAAQLLKANDTISAANRIEAGIADRAGRKAEPTGVAKVLGHLAKHAVLPVLAGERFGLHGVLGATALQEGAVPAYRAAAAGTNALAATVAPRLANVAQRAGEAAGGVSDVLARHVAAGNPKAIALTQALNASRSLGRPGSPSVGSVSTGTLAAQ
jgi:hypothetical protein